MKGSFQAPCTYTYNFNSLESVVRSKERETITTACPTEERGKGERQCENERGDGDTGRYDLNLLIILLE